MIETVTYQVAPSLPPRTARALRRGAYRVAVTGIDACAGENDPHGRRVLLTWFRDDGSERRSVWVREYPSWA